MRNGWLELPINVLNPVTHMLTEGTKPYAKGNLRVLFSSKERHLPDGSYWKHASVSHHARYPTWDEILDVRYSFFDENDEVVQILPPKGEYVNLHKNCFHLWSPIGKRITPQ